MIDHSVISRSIRVEFVLTIDPSDQFEYCDPTFKFGDKVKILDESCPHDDWEEYTVYAMELYAPRWRDTDTMMEAPQWRYGVRCARGTGELIWFTDNEIVQSNQSHLISFEMEF